MPIALDPTVTFKYTLKSDQTKGGKTLPCFEFRFLTGRQWKVLSELYSGIEKIAQGSEGYNKLCDAVRTGLIGWYNIKDRQGGDIAYDPDKLDEVLTITEVMELFFALLTRTSLDVDDKKKLDLPLDSGTAGYAKDAPDQPNAEVSQRISNP